MATFDYEKYKTLMSLLEKKAQFVPMGGDPAAAGAPPPGDPAAGGDPAAMGGDPAAAGAPPPGDPAAMGGDPAAMGAPPPGDPAAMGGMPPMDPSMMGGMPPMDPAAMGGMPDPAAGDVSPSGEPYMKITPTQLSKLFKQFAEVFKSVLGIQGTPQQPAPAAQPQSDPAAQAEQNAKLDAILSALQ